MSFKLPLMRNNILREDLDVIIEHLKQDDPILTQSKNVKAFEKEWSEWLGVKYSVFVNSGSSANFISMAVLRLRYPDGGEVIVPPLTWVSDIVSVIQNGFTPVFVDIDPFTLGMNSKQVIEKLNSSTRAVFLTHVQGFNALTDGLLLELKQRDIPLIEDVCESHGATHNNIKVGSFGWMSNFSFYYAHHMSTIEGGMICTNDSDLYQQLRLLRSHGMVRESDDMKFRNDYIQKYPKLNPDFIFAFPGFNMRNTEIGGLMGRSQLKRLDEIISRRNHNQDIFLNEINSDIFRTDFKTEGCSNYAFNLVIKEADIEYTEKLMRKMGSNGIEFRRGSAGGGNQLRQPYLKGIVADNEYQNYPEIEHIHFHGFYIGNFPDLRENEITKLCHILNM